MCNADCMGSFYEAEVIRRLEWLEDLLDYHMHELEIVKVVDGNKQVGRLFDDLSEYFQHYPLCTADVDKEDE